MGDVVAAAPRQPGNVASGINKVRMTKPKIYNVYLYFNCASSARRKLLGSWRRQGPPRADGIDDANTWTAQAWLGITLPLPPDQ